jgi:ISXO2-like transposase domain
VLTGSIFHGSHIPLRTWLMVIFDACSAKNGISAREVERKYDLTPKSAWYLMHRVREAMKREPMAGLLSGRVVADETWFGGKPANRKGHDASKFKPGTHDRTPIMALVSRETGEVRTQVVPNVRGDTLRSVLLQHTEPSRDPPRDRPGADYRKVAEGFASHSTVDHEAREYVGRDGATTNPAEAFFAQLHGRSTGRTITSAASTWTATSRSLRSATRPASRPILSG